MSSKSNNEISTETIRYYDERADAFAKDTAHANVSGILREFTALIPPNATVLDWGCGTGRDSRAMLDMGFDVTSADASRAMCEIARKTFGIEAACESFDELDAESVYDGIWACASLLHVKKPDLPSVLEKARVALKPGGVLYASFKLGDFEGIRDDRWYSDLDEEALVELAQPGFELLKTWITGDVRPGRSEEKWLNCLLKRRS